MLVIIKIERSGGLLGTKTSKRCKADDLPSNLMSIIKQKIIDTTSPPVMLKSTPKGAADYYTYKISVEYGSKRKVIECNQLSISEDLRSLIKFVEKHSKAT